MRTKYILQAAVAVACIGQAVPTFAQETDSSGAFVDNGDIVVTARRREESIMKVPVVTTAIDSKQLEQFQVTDIRRVAEQVPGLVVGEPASAAYGAQLSLRGVGTSVLNGTIDQSISLNLDSQQFNQGLAFSAGMFDLQQITVLKGPQALFFGKASPGGVVAIQSNNPGPDFEMIARAGYEVEADAKQGELIVSGPISSTLGARLAGRLTQTEGYFRNIAPTPPPGLGAQTADPLRSTHAKEWILRGTLQWEPTDNFSARLKVTWTKNMVQGRAGQFVSCPEGIAGNGGIQYLAANEDCKLDRNFTMVDLDPAAFNNNPQGARIQRNGRQFSDVEQTFGVLELNYRPSDELTATSVTGYYDANSEDQFNSGSTSNAGPIFPSYTLYTREAFTQEVRLASDFKDFPVNFTLGGYYEKIDQFKLGQAILNATQRAPGGYLSNGTHDNPNEAISLFGQLLWKITPQLELAGGARWTHENRKHVYTNLLVSTTPVRLAVPELKSNRVSPEVTLTYTPSDDFTVFGAFKKGYKSGSHNSSGSFRDGDDSSFNDEMVQGGEVGIKTRLLDRALSFNLSGYHYKYSGLQVGANADSSEGIIIAKTLNAASAKIYGIEGDLAYRPPSVEGLTLRAAASWNHARYGSFRNAPCWGGQRTQDGCDLGFNRSALAQQAGTGPLGATFVADPAGPGRQNGVAGYYGFYTSQDLSGRELLRSPDFTASGGFDYEMPIGGGMRLLFGASMRYSSKFYADILLRNDELQTAYAKLNGNLTLYGPDDRWELSLIGNNLTDKVVLNRCSSSNGVNGVSPYLPTPIKGGTTRNAAGVDEIICTADPGREIWLRATFRL